MRSAARIATVVVAAMALCVGSAAAAVADAETVKDKRGDVVLDGKVSGNRSAAQKSVARQRDVTSVRVTLGAKNVSIKISLADLRRDDPSDGYQSVQIEFARKSITNKTGRVSPAFTLREDFGDGPTLARLFDGSDDEVICGTAYYTEGDHVGTAESFVKSEVKFGKSGYVKIQVPRRCLANESKIKVRTTVHGVKKTKKRDLYEDYVSASRSKTAAWTGWLLKS